MNSDISIHTASQYHNYSTITNQSNNFMNYSLYSLKFYYLLSLVVLFARVVRTVMYYIVASCYYGPVCLYFVKIVVVA